MLSITLRDHSRNSWIGHQIGVNDIIDVIKRRIHEWAGHVARFKDSILYRVNTTRMDNMAGRPKTRWRDNLIRHLGPAWPKIVSDRRLWRQFQKGVPDYGAIETMVENCGNRGGR